MSWWITIRRIFSSGFLNFWRTPVVSLASVITLTVALFVIGSLLLAGAFLNASLADIQSKVDISVSFKPDAAEEAIVAIKESLQTLPEVASVVYRSQEEELADFRERNQDNELILRSLDEVGNPFGARLNIQAVDPAYYENIATFLESDRALVPSSADGIIDQISFKKNVVDRLLHLIGVYRQVGLAVTAVLIFISLVVTFNTISLAIYSSRDEIAIMKLVGATDFYVRGPFIVAGVMAGTLAALLALFLLYLSTIWLRQTTGGVFGGIDVISYFANNFVSIFLVLLGSGVFLGMVSSFLAARRHLRV